MDQKQKHIIAIIILFIFLGIVIGVSAGLFAYYLGV